MGSLFSSKVKTATDPTALESFTKVRPVLERVANEGQNFANIYFNNPAYTGQRVAAMDPYSIESGQWLGNYFRNTASNATNAATGSGLSNAMASTEFGNNSKNIFNNYGTGDQTGNAIAAGNQFANNPYVDGLINASSRDVTRQLFERDLPGMNRQATGTGNLNSTRAGVESAILQRGAADRLADMSSQIRSQFFNQGVNQYNQNLTNAMTANRGLMDAGRFGLEGLLSGQNLATGSFNQGQAAGNVFQDQKQRELDASKAYFDESFGNRLNVLNALTNITSGGQGFKSVAGTATQPSTAQQIASIFGAFV